MDNMIVCSQVEKCGFVTTSCPVTRGQIEASRPITIHGCTLSGLKERESPDAPLSFAECRMCVENRLKSRPLTLMSLDDRLTRMENKSLNNLEVLGELSRVDDHLQYVEDRLSVIEGKVAIHNYR